MGQKGARGGGRQPLRQPRRCDARETVLRPAARGQVAAATRRRARPVPAPHVEAQRPVLPEGVRPGATRDTGTASAQAGKRQGPRACNRGALRAWSARFRAPSSARRCRGPVGRRECRPPRDSAGAARPSSRVPGCGRTGSLGWPGTHCRARHGCCSVLCRFLGDSGRFSAPQVKRERSERWPRVRPRQGSAPHSSSHAGGEVPSAALCPASRFKPASRLTPGLVPCETVRTGKTKSVSPGFRCLPQNRSSAEESSASPCISGRALKKKITA